MNWKSFHHPDLSLPVIRRRASEEWLDILSGVGEILATRGKSVLWSRTYPNSTAYYNSMARLRKKGLIVRADNKGNLPHLILTASAKNSRPVYYQPEKLWNTRWNKIWYMLIFDVPEKERHYRDTLRRFLKTLRMGCLQKSVWITPRDIRPQYDDLEKAACVGSVAYLLESQTVLHQDQQELVQNSWGFSRLYELQSRYVEVFGENLELLDQQEASEEDLLSLLYQESEAYIQAMRPDPLLPKELHPASYIGPHVWEIHNKLRTKIAHAL